LRVADGEILRNRVLFVLTALAGAAFAQKAAYEGPTILSRGVGPVLAGGGDLLRIKPFLSVMGVYDTNLTPVSVDSQGRIPEEDGYGGELGFGAIGYRTWRDTVLGLDYRGNVRHYSQQSYYDGSDHTLTLGVTHRLSRSAVLSLREAAGTYSRSFGPMGGLGYFDPSFADIPQNELFDGRTNYLTTLGDLTLEKGPRLSFNMGGSGLVVRRRSRSLIGVTGWTARGDTAYRVSRNHTIGVDYGFHHYDYTNAFGASDIHTVAFDWSARIGRNWSFGLRAGVSRVETLGLRRVALDPIIAMILGQTAGIETFYRINYVPSGNMRLTRAFRRSSVSLEYNRGTSSGNGVYLTSQQEAAGVNVSHTASQRWNVGASVGYDSYRSLGQTLGKYKSYHGGGGVTFQMTSALHFVTRCDARRYDVENTAFKRIHYRASVGFALSPGDMPLSLW
jgi:hypothetical protein